MLPWAVRQGVLLGLGVDFSIAGGRGVLTLIHRFAPGSDSPRFLASPGSDSSRFWASPGSDSSRFWASPGSDSPRFWASPGSDSPRFWASPGSDSPRFLASPGSDSPRFWASPGSIAPASWLAPVLTVGEAEGSATRHSRRGADRDGGKSSGKPFAPAWFVC